MASPARTVLEEREALALCDLSALAADARDVLAPEMTGAGLYDALVSAGRPMDAARVLAHSLPPRDAVWWSWQCAVQAAGASPTPGVLDALDAIREWFMDPTDERRHRAADLAEAVGFDQPVGCCGLGTLFSGGSIAPPDLEEVPAPDGACGINVAGAVILSALVCRPEDPSGLVLEFLDAWWRVADEPRPWDAESTDPAGEYESGEYNPNAKFD